MTMSSAAPPPPYAPAQDVSIRQAGQKLLFSDLPLSVLHRILTTYCDPSLGEEEFTRRLWAMHRSARAVERRLYQGKSIMTPPADISRNIDPSRSLPLNLPITHQASEQLRPLPAKLINAIRHEFRLLAPSSRDGRFRSLHCAEIGHLASTS
jgi:hypothetical protein